MLIEIISKDNGSGMNSNLDVYLAYNEKQKLFEQKPFCCIDEDDFTELLTDREADKYLHGKYQFNLSKAKITEKAKTIYSRY
jgi:hypothetical protein